LLDVRELCGIYGADEEETAGLIGLAQQASVKSWWHEYGNVIPDGFDVYMGLESAARRLTSYAPDAVLGVLQTTGYARALLRSALPREGSEGIEQRLQVKMKRQRLITRKRQPTELNVVLMECALRRVVGGPKVMHTQLRHLADMSTLSNISVRILPFQAGIPLGDPISPFTVLDFGADKQGELLEPPVVYLENYTGDMYLERPDDVRHYYEAQRTLVRAALDENASRALLRQVAKGYVR